MLRLLKNLALFFLIIVPAIALAVANRHQVELVLDPFTPQNPALSISLPMFAYLFAALISGLMLGGIATWMNQGKWRRTSRKQTAEAARWRLEADQLKRQMEAETQPKLPSAISTR